MTIQHDDHIDGHLVLLGWGMLNKIVSQLQCNIVQIHTYAYTPPPPPYAALGAHLLTQQPGVLGVDDAEKIVTFFRLFSLSKAPQGYIYTKVYTD